MTLAILWIGIGLGLIVVVALLTVSRVKKNSRELGSVSVHWLAEHRVDWQ